MKIDFSESGQYQRVESDFLLRNSTSYQALYERDEHQHQNFITNSNVYALDVVEANYVEDGALRTGRVALPTTRDTGYYIALDDGYSLETSQFPVTSEYIQTSQVVVVLDPEIVYSTNDIPRVVPKAEDGFVFVASEAQQEFLKALDLKG